MTIPTKRECTYVYFGDLKNSGTISMTARGTYNQKGENVYLWKNIDNTYEYIPEVRRRPVQKDKQ